ncbi:MAG TPA: hypothetical protein VKG05_13790 [Steroidobacteraceae bacterium]|nr:hypothetical protein [Steroidobacteraceae bacterium]
MQHGPASANLIAAMAVATVLAAAGHIAGCAGPRAREPIENLDERTGITIATLQAPIEFVETGVLNVGKRSSFAYLGPVEWDRMGEIRYGLWMHVAPGNDRAVGDITSPAAVSLSLDDAVVPLSILEAPRLGLEAYASAVPWGQTAYFALSADLLKRLAAAERLTLHFRGLDAQLVDFEPIRASLPALAAFARSRGLIVD